ncbi:hypothetical protein niasHT_026271 [Heterodera trifolii]|uniref:Uncharacterized protein n=1 Tax=Heterodera trifolii TaxID=157864 RepID=A0ABD2JV32_9BILA
MEVPSVEWLNSLLPAFSSLRLSEHSVPSLCKFLSPLLTHPSSAPELFSLKLLIPVKGHSAKLARTGLYLFLALYPQRANAFCWRIGLLSAQSHLPHGT